MTPTPKRKRYLWGGLLTLAVLIGLAGIILHVKTYQPTASANQASQAATVSKNVTTFKAKNSKLTVVFYPGGLVEPASYSNWAAQLAQADKKNLKGVFLLAAYADQKGRLDHSKLPVLSVTASRDGVLNWSHYEANKKYLPRDTTFTTISGGNHGGFGSYGHQQGDKVAHISNTTQQKQVAHLLIKWLKRIN